MTDSSDWTKVSQFPIEYRQLAMVSLQSFVNNTPSQTLFYYRDAHNWAAMLPGEAIRSAARDDDSLIYSGRGEVEDARVICLASVADSDQLASLLKRFDHGLAESGSLNLVGILLPGDDVQESIVESGSHPLGEPVGELHLKGVLASRIRFAIFSLASAQTESELKSLPKPRFEEGDNLSRREDWFKRRSGIGTTPNDDG